MSLKTDRRHDPKLKPAKVALDQFDNREKIILVAKNFKESLCI